MLQSNDDIKFGKIICSQVVVIRESLGLHAERTSGFTNVPVFNRDRKVFPAAILAACIMATRVVEFSSGGYKIRKIENFTTCISIF